MDFLRIVNSKKYIFNVSVVYKSGQNVIFKLSVVVEYMVLKQQNAVI